MEAAYQFFSPPRFSIMTEMAKGYFDDSKSDGQALAVAGYMGTSSAWEVFESAWSMVLVNHDVPYFHMREMNDPDGPFAKWLPHSQHRAEVADFFGDLATAIKASGITGFCSLVRIKDLAQFNEEFGINLEAYPLAVYGCMVVVARHFITMPIQMIFDRIEKLESKLAKARALANTDNNSDVFHRTSLCPFLRRLLSETFQPYRLPITMFGSREKDI